MFTNNRLTAMSFAVGVISCLLSLNAAAAVFEFGANLSSSNEVPSAGAPAVPTDGTGDAFLVFDDMSGELGWLISFEDLAAPIFEVGAGPTAHIHLAGPTENGPVVISLDSTNPSTIISGEGKSEGIFLGAQILDETDATDLGIITALFAGDLYINFHTAARAAGEIRGQILPASVVPIPVPAAAWLMISAIATMFGARRFTS